ncbi:MAG: sterol desaturase/sphingolipid hydroxylase (fatty acid hydroxylase superfamily) [Candidatus Saccharimonadales bacterium]|jgi:sterol desaturase/sphingolipid hydroxylase (fatty acid hydroxylase superfamily)
MDWVETLKDVNYVAVLAAVAASFAVGMVWYSELAFGKTWMKLTGLKKKDVENKDKMMKGMMHTAISSLIKGAVLAALIMVVGIDGWAEGAVFGAVIGFGLVMTSAAMHDAFSHKPMLLTKINGLHDIVSFAAMAAVIAGIGA